MCGFAGELLFAPGGRADLDLARRMAQAVAHRGPDDHQAFLSDDGRCAIGFHRLAVIDPPGSRQPMTCPDRRHTVAFNGEIYNFRSLRADLQAHGAAFATAGDTEVLLHLYRRYGRDMLPHLDGMFAFILYDAASGSLLLARDRLGQKPLWYALLADRVVFASEAAAVLRHPQVDRSPSRESIAAYFSVGYIPAPQTVWQAVRKLPPASSLLISNGPAEPVRYWHLPGSPPSACAADSAERIRAELGAAVAACMYADVPLGALLSGGLDSSLVVALMSQAAGRSGGVRTFTAGFEDVAYDERPAARRVAERFGTEHTELLVRPAPREQLDQLIRMYGEPFADSSALPTWLICRAAREHVTVALTGDGGDEAFGGYDRYRAMHLADTMRPPTYLAVRLTAWLAGLFAPREERSRLRRLVRFAEALPYPPAVQYFMHRRLFGPEDLPRLFTQEFAAGLDLDAPATWFCNLYEDGDFQDEVAYGQRHDLLTYLPDDLLVKTDIASMAAGLEARCPFLDHRVVALGLSLPVEMKIAHGRGKAILREAFADLLPKETLLGPKRGFGVPLGRWLREDLFGTLRETLMDPWLHRQGIFRPEALAGLLNDHFSGRDDHRHRLWALLVFARWLAMQQ
jgi:asparagine synthase (glutamine-hydrolysing)